MFLSILLAVVSPTLQYNAPANYFEESLVIGNGTFGAAVYGGVEEDRLSLNDLTLWTGEPCANNVFNPNAWQHIEGVRALLDKEYYAAADKAYMAVEGEYTQNYQPLGTLTITNLSGNDATGYHRSLTLNQAIARVEYAGQEREYFASAPDSVMVIHITAKPGHTINQRIGIHSMLNTQLKVKDNDLICDGFAAYKSDPNYTDHPVMRAQDNRGIHFRTIVRAIPLKGGSVKAISNYGLMVQDCQELVLLVANVTSFNGRYKDPVKEGRDYKTLVKNRIEKATATQLRTLRERHVADFSSYFDRVQLDLGTTAPEIAALPTDVQLKQYGAADQRNPDLEELYFQFGRYLLISCSRTEGVPANLQGLWNEHLLPPWSCNYTSNINLEENYWAAETANLSEMHQPMLDFVMSLPESGAITAKNYYNVQRGWCLGHNTDIWGLTNPVGRGEGDPCWAAWNMGGAWVSTHLWEHYTFTLDKAFLAKAYPALRGAADFCLDWMIEKEGRLLTSPCTSPENRYLIPESGVTGATFYGGFADIAMIKECLSDTRAAAQELGIDAAYCDTLTQVINKLLPYRIGARGNLQEFFHDWEGEDPQHRHQSHLFGVYPGHHITVKETPKLAKAAARSLEIKGPKSTGWSTGWRINLQARLHNGAMAYETYRKLLTYIAPTGKGGGTYPNLLDSHNPFQIDGNFGGCAGVIEMLMQSSYTPGNLPIIELLPAIPEAWKAEGSVKGLRARGGFEVSFAWKNGKITTYEVKPLTTNQHYQIVVNGRKIKK